MSLAGRPSAQRSHTSDFFGQLEARFRQALSVAGRETIDLNLAGFHVRLEFAGTVIQSTLLPALAHARTESPEGEPDFTIGIWDSASTGVDCPPPAWTEDDYRQRGLIRGFNTKRYKTCFQIGPNTLNMLDTESRLGIQWVRDADTLPYYEKGAPLRHLLNWWMLDNGYMLIHAAAVSTGDRSALLVGKGGSGKSTSAISCLGSSLKFISDDYCLVGPPHAPSVHSLYSTAKLTPDSLQRFPILAEGIRDSSLIADDKLLFFLHPGYRDDMVSGVPLHTIFVPHIDVSTTSTAVEPISKARALLALAPSSIFQLSGAGGQEFEQLSALVERTECRMLRLSPDLPSIARVIHDYLDGANS